MVCADDHFCFVSHAAAAALAVGLLASDGDARLESQPRQAPVPRGRDGRYARSGAFAEGFGGQHGAPAEAEGRREGNEVP